MDTYYVMVALSICTGIAAGAWSWCYYDVCQLRRSIKLHDQHLIKAYTALNDEQVAHNRTRSTLNKHADELATNWHQTKAKLYDAQCEYKRDTAKLKATQDELARWRCSALDILDPQRTGL